MPDCLMFARHQSVLDDLCRCLSTEFLLKDEGDIESFLGIKIMHTIEQDGSITITVAQPGLISQILDDVDFPETKLPKNERQHKPFCRLTPPLLHSTPHGIIDP
jgi:hypothetical protein